MKTKIQLLASAALASAVLATPTYAQTLLASAAADVPGAVDEPAAATGGDDVVVTGSRVKGGAPVGSAILLTNRADIEQSNATTTSQLFLNMPAVNNLGVSENNRSGNGASANFNFSQGINIHGIGPYATLVLVDGQRVAPQGVYGLAVDTAIVPLNALERVEIVPDGASAIYGSDAIAGVANLILRRNFKGIEPSGSYGFADNYRQYQAGLIAGTSWGSGHGTLTYNFSGHSALRASDRDYAQANLTAQGGTDYRATQCNPGNIVIGGVSYAIPTGGVTPATAGLLQANTANRCDNFASSYLIPNVRRHNAVGTFDQDIADTLSINATGIYARREVATRGTIGATTLAIPTSNAFYTRPTGAAAGAETIRYAFTDFPDSANSGGTSDFYQGTVGAKLKLPHGWKASAAFTYGGSTEHYYQLHNVNTAALNAALASSNPATAFNPYGGVNSAAVLAAIGIGQFSPSGKEDQDVTDLGLSGALLHLPGGDVQLAIGYQHFRSRQHSLGRSGTTLAPIDTVSVDFTRRVNSGYGELLLPIFGAGNAITGFKSLQIDVAVRHDSYSDVGSTTNPKVGVDWEVVGGLKFHGSYGTSFRAPPVYQSQGSAATSIVSLPDPLLGGAAVSTLEITGGNPSTKPETATTFSFGVDVSPALVPGLTAQLSYFNVNYRDIITALGNNTQLLNQSYYASLGLITRNPTAAQVADALAKYPLVGGVVPSTVPVLIDARTRNLSSVKASGLDFVVNYLLPTQSIGTFNLGISGEYYLKFGSSAVQGAPEVDLVGTTLNPVEYQLRPYVAWNRGALNARAAVNLTAGYDNNLVTPVQKVSSYTTVDLHLDYDLAGLLPIGSKRLRVAFDATNLFDRKPPFVNISPSSVTEGGYDSSLVSPVGRILALSLVATY